MLGKAIRNEFVLMASFLAILTLFRVVNLYISPFDLYGDEAQYWLWSKTFEFGYYSKPPIMSWVIGVFTSIFGEGEAAIRLASPILHLCIALIIYRIAQEAFDRRVAMWSALTYITLPAVSLSSALISTDPFLMLFWALSLLFYIKAFKHDELKWWLLLGMTFGLGMLAKYSMGVFAVSIIVHLLLTKKLMGTFKNPKIWGAGFLAFLIWLPNLMWNIDNSMSSFNHTLDLAKGRPGTNLSTKNLVVFFVSQLAVFGPILFSALLVFVFKKRKLDINERILTVFALAFLTLMMVLAFISKAHANWAAPAYIAATILVVRFLIKSGKENFVRMSFALHVFLGLSLMLYISLIENFDITLSKYSDPLKRVRGGKEIGRQLDGYLKKYPSKIWATDDRMNLSLFTYYTTPKAYNILKWNPTGQIKDHFDLKSDLNEYKGKDVIVVSSYHTEKSLVAYGDLVEEVGSLYYSPYDEFEKKFRVIMIRNFKGY